MYFIVIFFSYNIFGFEDKTIAWFNSYLTGRSQRVKIGDKKSSSQNLLSGVPQGSMLSPLVFVIYNFYEAPRRNSNLGPKAFSLLEFEIAP